MDVVTDKTLLMCGHFTNEGQRSF